MSSNCNATYTRLSRKSQGLGDGERTVGGQRGEQRAGKTDAADAEAICEAVRRPSMRFVEIKWTDQQAFLAVHRSRDLVVRQKTQVVNMIRSVLREFGHVLPTGVEAVNRFSQSHMDGDQLDMPELANGILGMLCYQLLGLNARIEGYTRLIKQHALLDANCRRLTKIPGIGPITASAMVATIGDGSQFRTGRDLAAWLGLTPLNKSSGGKERLGNGRQIPSKATGCRDDIARVASKEPS